MEGPQVRELSLILPPTSADIASSHTLHIQPPVSLQHTPPTPIHTHTLHTGQAGAIRLGISRALLAFPGNHGDTLEKAGLLVRDPRMVERKKPGQKKARKKFAW